MTSEFIQRLLSHRPLPAAAPTYAFRDAYRSARLLSAFGLGLPSAIFALAPSVFATAALLPFTTFSSFPEDAASCLELSTESMDGCETSEGTTPVSLLYLLEKLHQSPCTIVQSPMQTLFFSLQHVHLLLQTHYPRMRSPDPSSLLQYPSIQ